MNKEKTSLFTNYLNHLNRSGVSPESLKTRTSRINRFALHCAETNTPVETFCVPDALAYIDYLKKEHGLSAGTLRCHAAELKTFYDWLIKKGEAFSNPFARLPLPLKGKPLPMKPLKEKAMETLLHKLADYKKEEDNLLQTIARYQAHIVAELLYATGMRVGEAAALRPEDVDLVRGEVNVHTLKHGRPRVCVLNEYARIILSLYEKHIRPLLVKGKRPNKDLFFLMGKSTLEKKIVPVLQEQQPGFTTHGFRHAVGTHLLRAGCDLRYIQDILGHKSLGTTQIYTKLEKEDIKQMLDTYHPRQLKNRDHARKEKQAS